MARKFTFNLQKYLDYKESIVNGKAADLLKSKKLLDKENNKLEKLFDEKEIAKLDYKKNKPSRILDLAIMSSYLNQISKNIDDQKIVITPCKIIKIGLTYFTVYSFLHETYIGHLIFFQYFFSYSFYVLIIFFL
jgi:hypothetical protein